MTRQSGTVVAISISQVKGIPKSNVAQAELISDFGIIGDAHAGSGHRQISLLAIESIRSMQAKGAQVEPGNFAENITTEGISLINLAIGDLIQIGKCLLQVTQIGKECHSRCAIFEIAGDCVMPREGIFTKVLTGGSIKVGDTITIQANSED